MQISLQCKRFVFFLLLLLPSGVLSSAEQERYLHFTETDGLPRNITTCLEQDQYGYLWIGTTNGIARYDGKSFLSYPETSGNSIIYLLPDSQKNLWVATNKGLLKYNRITNYFDHIVDGYISRVLEDRGDIYYLLLSGIYRFRGNTAQLVYQGADLTDFCFAGEGLWVSKVNDGVWLFSRESGFNKITQKYLPGKYVSNVVKIEKLLFAGCYNGELYTISDEGKTRFISINNHYYFKDIVKVGQEIWLATDGHGVIVLDKNLQLSGILNRNKNTNASFNSNSIYDILVGNNNEIWLASYGAGLTCILPDNLLFQNLLPEKGVENSLVANEGVSIFVKEPNLYLGTNYGMSVYNPLTRQFRNLDSEKLIRELKGSKVLAITSDSKGFLWLGTYDGLLGKYTSDFKLIKSFQPIGEGTDQMQQIVDLHEIDNGNLLIHTQFYKSILLYFDTQKGTAKSFELYKKGSRLNYFLLHSFRKNQEGELLAIISDQGLFHVNIKDCILENRLSAMNHKIGAYINDFYHDKKGFYWMASSSNGMIRISEDGKNYKKFTTKEGLPANTLLRIESVDDRFLWISSISGICRFDMESEQILNFNLSDGLPANEFQERVSAKTFDGKIIFGSMAGFTIVDPSKLNPDALKTEVIISDITSQNQSLRKHEGKQFFKEPLEVTKEIRLPYSKNSFSIHFFAKNKSFLKYHNYAYRLTGLEKEWTYLETNHASYTNLKPGKYTFEVKTADKSKEGSPTRLTIQILAPWYLRWYAYLAYAAICAALLYLSTYAYKKRIELQKEKEISDFKIKSEHELTEKKLAFFTNISHDLKTPLTLIDAPVNDLLQSGNLNQDQVNKLMLINRNSKRLYKLISDLLDFRKITQKQYVLEVKETEIAEIINDVADAFREECNNKSIELITDVEKNLLGFIDHKKIEKILWNLLSNALKFTPDGGKIVLSAKIIIAEEKKLLKLEVRDNGTGISDKNKSRIFERFFTAQDTQSINKEGTGIGLSIVKELTDMHHGNISVESSVGKGTTFTILLPFEKDNFDQMELVVSEPDFLLPEITEALESNHQEAKKQYNLHNILLVEDNAELRDYLAGHFKKKYKVFVAEDGFQGLKLAKEMNPDIIVTDVQMPNLDGYGFCRELRRNFDTSHIPVIMLTANNSLEHQIEGLSRGADSYMTKPFEIKLLDVQVHSLLENRKTLRNKFQGIDTPENLEKSLPGKDVSFILEMKLYIEENMMNKELSVELLAEHFAVSLPQLHRKIKALTGSTPNNLIKSIRLKKAYKLIRESGFRVSEAAYQTGFSDPNYFTICFKKEFGENPSQVAGS